jgi:methylmalonyl-CoA mutase
VIIEASTPAGEISNALIQGVQCFTFASEKKIPPADVVGRIAFSLATENNFLLNIAKFKALRLLWYQVVRAYGIGKFAVSDLHLHARHSPWTKEKFQPHGNMLAGTVSALAAIAGGCDALTVHAEDENNIMMNRISRNIAAVLREESHLDKVSDPLAGAYALDVMVNDIAQKAWERFQADVKKI